MFPQVRKLLAKRARSDVLGSSPQKKNSAGEGPMTLMDVSIHCTSGWLQFYPSYPFSRVLVLAFFQELVWTLKLVRALLLGLEGLILFCSRLLIG